MALRMLDAITTDRIVELSRQWFQSSPSSVITCGLRGFAGGRFSQTIAMWPE